MKDDALKLIERLVNEADLCRNDGANDIAALLDEAAKALAAPVQEPVQDERQCAASVGKFGKLCGSCHGCLAGNHTPPAARRQWVELTDEQIEHLWETRVGQPCPSYPLEKSDWLQFARAIEAAHGIKEKNNE